MDAIFSWLSSNPAETTLIVGTILNLLGRIPAVEAVAPKVFNLLRALLPDILGALPTTTGVKK